MARSDDARRVAHLRDLLLDYPYEKASSHPFPPEGLEDEAEIEAWIDDWYAHNGPPPMLEGGYANAAKGQPDAALTATGGLPVLDAVRATGQELRRVMPEGGTTGPVPPGAPNRALALASRLRRG